MNKNILKLKCPICQTELTITHKDLLEYAPLKEIYQCSNNNCIAHQCKVSWIEDGSCYFDNNTESIDGITFFDLDKLNDEFKNTSYNAINSFNYFYDIGKREIDKYTFNINLYFFIFKISPKQKGHKFPINKRYQPNFLKWNIKIYKRTNNNSYYQIIPFYKLVKSKLKDFNHYYNQWNTSIDKSDKYSFNSCYYIITGRDTIGHIDNRFFSKFTKYWINLFYPKKVNIIIEAKLSENFNIILKAKLSENKINNK